MAMVRLLITLVLLVGTQGCALDEEEIAAAVEANDDEVVRATIDAGDLESAAAYLEEVIAAEPTGYKRYVQAAALYANLAGLDLLNMLLGQVGSGSGGAMEQMSSFVPSTPTARQIGFMKRAVELLVAIPPELRSPGSVADYSASAAFQITLYQTAYSMMKINQFFQVDPDTDAYDAETLAAMTDEEVDEILASLQASVDNASGASGEALQAKLIEALAGIEGSEGGSNREKLIAYMSAQNGTPVEPD